MEATLGQTGSKAPPLGLIECGLQLLLARPWRSGLIGRNLDLFGALARAGNVIAVLHAHERIHRHAEGLFDARFYL